MSFKVIHGGLFSQIQDLGRFGHGHTGFSQGGCLDLKAACWANYLLGNASSCAVIEVTLGQLILEATHDTVIAICGADMKVHLNHQLISPWRTTVIKASDSLTFQTCQQGMRAYLSVLGGFNIKAQLGSVATATRDQLGGLASGEKLKQGDVLPFTPASRRQQMALLHRCVPRAFYQHGYQANARSWVSLGIFKGPQWHQFSARDQQQFMNQPYQLDQQSNRMAATFTGQALTSQLKGIVSQGINLGAIQVPPSGLPVALLSDRQSLGGYAKIANLTTPACWQLAQLPPGCQVQFHWADLAMAQRTLRQFYQFFSVKL